MSMHPPFNLNSLRSLVYATSMYCYAFYCSFCILVVYLFSLLSSRAFSFHSAIFSLFPTQHIYSVSLCCLPSVIWLLANTEVRLIAYFMSTLYTHCVLVVYLLLGDLVQSFGYLQTLSYLFLVQLLP